MTAPGPLIARGRAAEVYAHGEGHVDKLLLAGRARREVEREASNGRIVREASIPAPAIHEIVELDGRFGEVFERVDGPSMLDVLLANPWLVARLAAPPRTSATFAPPSGSCWSASPGSRG